MFRKVVATQDVTNAFCLPSLHYVDKNVIFFLTELMYYRGFPAVRVVRCYVIVVLSKRIVLQT